MDVLTPVEGREEFVPRYMLTAQLKNCMYVMVFTAVYGLSFAMPFWSDELPTPVTTPIPYVTSTYTTDGHAHDGTFHPRSFHDIWRFSWEYVGLAVRCLALAVLLCGSGASLWQWCCGKMHPASFLSLSSICGIVGGIMGAYAEVVLWMGVILLFPNPALTQSQVFCSVTSIFCFVIGIVVHRTNRPNRNSTSPRQTVVPCSDEEERFEYLKQHDRSNLKHFGASLDTPKKRNVATETEEVHGYNTSRGFLIEDDQGSDPIEDHEQCEQSTKDFTTHVCAEVCSSEDLPDDLNRPTEVHNQEELPSLSQQNSSEKHSPQDLDDLKILMSPERTTCLADNLNQNGVFDHRTQFIDDDLYYHSSDDDQLERFIRHGSSPQEKQSVGSEDNMSITSTSSTKRLIQTERPLLLPFCDSEEFHSLSDEGDSDKNKTWP